MDIDKKRVAAVRLLEGLGYHYRDGAWEPPASVSGAPFPFAPEADAMLMRHADALEGCIEGSDEEADRKATVDAIAAYEAKRWPLGKEPGGKG